jgi:transcriptional regulator with XRE-family HTH domain
MKSGSNDDPKEPRIDTYLRTAQALRTEMAQRRMTQEALAKLTGLSLATVGRTLRGKFRPETILLIESKLDVPLQGAARSPPTVSSAQFGSYHYDAVSHLAGDYLCARRSFAQPGHLALYPLSIRWAAAPAGLAFEERNSMGRTDYSQNGYAHIPPGCSYLHLATIDRGSVRLITVSFVADKLIESEPLRGLILTLYNPVASSHVPAVSPFIMQRMRGGDPRTALHGVIAETDVRVRGIAEELNLTERHQVMSAIRPPGGKA